MMTDKLQNSNCDLQVKTRHYLDVIQVTTVAVADG